MWERDTIATAEAAVTPTDEDGSRGALSGLRRAWPTFVCCGHCRTETEEGSCPAVEEENCPAVGVQDGTTGAATGEEMAAG